MTQISRSIADTGEPARRGEPYGFSTLVPWLDRAGLVDRARASAYEAIKTCRRS